MENNNSITAVEWLMEQYIDKSTITLEIFQQANKMFEEQVIEARFTAPLLPSIDKSAYLQ